MTKAEFDAEIARLKASFTALLAKREPEPRKSLAGPRGRKLRELCKAAQAASDEEAKVNELAIGEIVLLRYAEGVKWPKWVGRAGDLNINHIEAVLDALGVP